MGKGAAPLGYSRGDILGALWGLGEPSLAGSKGINLSWRKGGSGELLTPQLPDRVRQLRDGDFSWEKGQDEREQPQAVSGEAQVGFRENSLMERVVRPWKGLPRVVWSHPSCHHRMTPLLSFPFALGRGHGRNGREEEKWICQEKKETQREQKLGKKQRGLCSLIPRDEGTEPMLPSGIPAWKCPRPGWRTWDRGKCPCPWQEAGTR